jgi:hypothetical protein
MVARSHIKEARMWRNIFSGAVTLILEAEMQLTEWLWF